MKELQEIILNITKVGVFNIATPPKKPNNEKWTNVTSGGDFPPDDGKNPGIRSDEYKEDQDFYNPLENIVLCEDHIL